MSLKKISILFVFYSMLISVLVDFLVVSSDIKLIISSVLSIIAVILIPGYFVFRHHNQYEKHILGLCSFSVLSTYLSIVIIHQVIALPAVGDLARNGNNIQQRQDGVGGNLVVIFGGWIIPLVITLFYMFIKNELIYNQQTEKNNEDDR